MATTSSSQPDHASEVEAVKNNVIGGKTTEMYLRGISRYVVWLYQHKRHVLSDLLLRAVEDNEADYLENDESVGVILKKEGVLRFLRENPKVPPVQYELHIAGDFEEFLMSLTTRAGGKPGQSVYDSMRSSIFHMYRRYGRSMSVEFAADLTVFLRG